MTSLSISTASTTGTSGTEVAASSQGVTSGADLSIAFEGSGGAAEARLAINGVDVPLDVRGLEAWFATSALGAGDGGALHVERTIVSEGTETLQVATVDFGAAPVLNDHAAPASLHLCALAGCPDPFGTGGVESSLSLSGFLDDWG